MTVVVTVAATVGIEEAGASAEIQAVALVADHPADLAAVPQVALAVVDSAADHPAVLAAVPQVALAVVDSAADLQVDLEGLRAEVVQ